MAHEEFVTKITKEQYALVVCDMQPDGLGSIPSKARKSLLLALRPALEVARLAGWSVVFSGLQFPKGYVDVNPKHKLYGGLQRLNARVGDGAAHWFMEGYAGSQITTGLVENDDDVAWRQRHVHLPNGELATHLKLKNISHVIVTGIKASGAIQSVVQLLCDEGLQVSVVRDCVQDVSSEVLGAMMNHLLPLYANVISLIQMVDDSVGINAFFEQASEHSRQNLMEHASTLGTDCNQDTLFQCTDCWRKGHGQRFVQLLLERPGWHSYPTQPWYGRMMEGEFFCPLGRKVVDFSDEPEFSQISMFLSGREWLDEKDKVVQFASNFMPKTYCLDLNGNWVGGKEPPSDEQNGAIDAPWFVKEADKNLGGDAIDICSKPSEIMNLVKPNRRYVVQQHVRDPLLTDDGKKTHLKFYVLLVCEQDGVSWTLYTYKSPLLSISPNPWSPNDLSKDTQITIHRHPVPPWETEGWKQHWPGTYEKCKQGTLDVIQSAVAEGRLKGRPGKKQFEVFSADWMPDTNGKMWLFEFNMSPAVCQQEFDNVAGRDARRHTLMTHDETMLRDALSTVLPWEGGTTPGLWDMVGEFTGPK